MLFRKAVCISLLVLFALAAPVVPQRVMNQNGPVTQADGGGPEPPPLPLPPMSTVAT